MPISYRWKYLTWKKKRKRKREGGRKEGRKQRKKERKMQLFQASQSEGPDSEQQGIHHSRCYFQRLLRLWPVSPLALISVHCGVPAEPLTFRLATCLWTENDLKKLFDTFKAQSFKLITTAHQGHLPGYRQDHLFNGHVLRQLRTKPDEMYLSHFLLWYFKYCDTSGWLSQL